MADRCGGAADREVNALDQCVDRRHDLVAEGRIQNRSVIADPEAYVLTAGTGAPEEAIDQLELRQPHGQCSFGRNARAARSSTAFTNL